MLTDDYFLGTKRYQKKFTELCKPISSYLGDITSACYININKDGTGFVIYSVEKWAERVLEKEYYKTEIGMVHPDNMHNGFSFCDASDYQEYKDGLLYDRAVNFNWTHSFSYVEKNASNDGYVGFGFGAAKENVQIANRLLNEAQTIKKFIKQLNNQLTLLISNDLKESRVDIATLKGGDLFHTQKGLVFNPQEENIKKLHLLKQAGFCSNTDTETLLTNPNLSPQEINCLRIYLMNHSITQVAETLGLAETTVSGYMENIKNKLHCTSNKQLLETGALLESLGHI
ncbi:MAG TPA: LuxR C-terminal-related transcriptional regulator [Gammaproteobacteria bacterium]|nr:LuxR C-terminal-related transcriptional regulator [Gammaproteobacteria bacterium]